jgi:hypothetical protein
MIEFGVFQFDTTLIETFFAQPIWLIALEFFLVFGWPLLFFVLVKQAFTRYVSYRQKKYRAPWSWVVLAVDIPQMNAQTPKAVEQFFAHLAGSLASPGLADKLRGGFVQRWFSFEIVSIEGYIQFIIRTEETFRELVEAALYAQYPGAAITEIEDYTTMVPTAYPNDTHDLWGAEFTLTEDSAYPIRTYREFEHMISKDELLKDPMGAFLESFSRIAIGEQMWFQIVVEPIPNKWKEDAIRKIKEVIGEKVKKKVSATQQTAEYAKAATKTTLKGFGDQIFGLGDGSSGGGDSKSSDKEPKNNLQYMTPGQTRLVDAMEDKISKLGYKTKMRGLYLARKEVFRPERGVHAMIGALNQFNVPTANSIAPSFNTAASDKRKQMILNDYIARTTGGAQKPFIMNIEELATVWHFPMSHVQTPQLKKKTVKSAEPPAELPIEEAFGQLPGVSAEPLAGNDDAEEIMFG